MQDIYTLKTISKELFSDPKILKRIIQGQRLFLTKLGIDGSFRTKIFIGYLVDSAINLEDNYWRTKPIVEDKCVMVSSINFITDTERSVREFRMSLSVPVTRVVNVISYLEGLEEEKIFPCFLYTTERGIQTYILTVNSHRTVPDIHYFSFASPFLIFTEVSSGYYSLEVIYNSRKELLPTQVNIGDLLSWELRLYDILFNAFPEILIPYLSLSRALYYFNRGEQFTMSIWLYTFFESFLAILLWFLNLEYEFNQLRRKASKNFMGKDFVYYVIERKEKGQIDDWMNYTKKGIGWVVGKIDNFIPGFKALIENFEGDFKWKRLKEIRRSLSHIGFAHIKGKEFHNIFSLADEFNSKVVDYIEASGRFPFTADLFKRPSFSKSLREFFGEIIEKGEKMYNEILEDIE